MENEIWKDVKGYEGYCQVSNMGRVKSMRVLKTRELLAQAYTDGYTAAEQSMWRSVEKELPSNDDKVFVIIHGAYVCGWYDQKYELWEIFGMGSYNRKDASYWMPIPPIPDTNTEKK